MRVNTVGIQTIKRCGQQYGCNKFCSQQYGCNLLAKSVILLFLTQRKWTIPTSTCEATGRYRQYFVHYCGLLRPILGCERWSAMHSQVLSIMLPVLHMVPLSEHQQAMLFWYRCQYFLYSNLHIKTHPFPSLPLVDLSPGMVVKFSKKIRVHTMDNLDCRMSLGNSCNFATGAFEGIF